MVIYFVVAVIIVAMISVIFGALLNKNKLLSFRTILAITLSSIIISAAIPFIFGAFISISRDGQVVFDLNIIWAIVITLVIYATALLISTVLISSIISDKKAKEVEDGVKNFFNNNLRNQKQNLHSDIGEQSSEEVSEPEQAVSKEFEENMEDQTGKQIDLAVDQEENIFEKSVDSVQIIDKMGVETIDIIGETVEESVIANMEDLYRNDSFDENGNYVINLDELAISEDFDFNVEQQESEYINEEKTADNIVSHTADESLTIEEYIDKAFDLKAKGDFEEAILNYMYALDKGPEKDLVFWIILDICVLYKSLGQAELATEILEGYISNYGELMDQSVKMEIERNLSYV